MSTPSNLAQELNPIHSWHDPIADNKAHVRVAVGLQPIVEDSESRFPIRPLQCLVSLAPEGIGVKRTPHHQQAEIAGSDFAD